MENSPSERRQIAQIGAETAPICAFCHRSLGGFSIVSVQTCPLQSYSGSKVGQRQMYGRRIRTVSSHSYREAHRSAAFSSKGSPFESLHRASRPLAGAAKRYIKLLKRFGKFRIFTSMQMKITWRCSFMSIKVMFGRMLSIVRITVCSPRWFMFTKKSSRKPLPDCAFTFRILRVLPFRDSGILPPVQAGSSHGSVRRWCR